MNLENLNLSAQGEAGYDLVLEHPVTKEPLDGIIRIRGDKSKTVQTFARRRVNEMQRRERMQKGKGKDTDLSIEELESMQIESAIARVISWKNIKLKNEEIPFTEANAEMIFKDYDWITTQVLEASGELANFSAE